MSPEEIKFLMELAILAPTSYNQQNWRFITATDQDVKDKISKAIQMPGKLILIDIGEMLPKKDKHKSPRL
jgi:nitroreductase